MCICIGGVIASGNENCRKITCRKLISPSHTQTHVGIKKSEMKTFIRAYNT